MLKLGRKAFFTGSAIACATTGMLRYPAGAAEFVYKWALDWHPGHPITIRAIQTAGKILADSGGRLQIRVFSNGILGSSVAQLTQTRSGAIEFAGVGYFFSELAGATASGLVILPFVFAGHREAWEAMDGPFGRAMRGAMSKLGLYVFERSWDGAFFEIANNVRPIRVPDDLKGLKVRIAPSPIQVATFKTFGASPVSVDASQMYVAAQSHIVDGTSLTLATMNNAKMYEVQKYASVLNTNWTGYEMVANPDAWRKLPGNVQEIVEQNMAAAALLERADMVKYDSEIVGTLRTKGMTVNDADIAAFKGAVRKAGLYNQWRDHYGADSFALLERAVGKLA